MLFRRRSHAGIRSGAIRRTHRIWKSPRVKVGGRYRLGTDGAIEVESVETGPLGEISTAGARLAGFENRDALRDELRACERSESRDVQAKQRVDSFVVTIGKTANERRSTCPRATGEIKP